MWQHNVVLFVIWLPSVIVGRDHPDKAKFTEQDAEIRVLGWALLGIWITAIVYMTRDFFFPSIFGSTSSKTAQCVAYRAIAAAKQTKTPVLLIVEQDETGQVARHTIIRQRSSLIETLGTRQQSAYV
uniref:SLC12 domain-containing protein n=1 Tax=Panagrellus redivivus TaxID=6233 RepID=A0A7E4VP86_PANRE